MSTRNRFVTSTWSQISDYTASGRGHKPGLLRRIDKRTKNLWPDSCAIPPDIESLAHFVDFNWTEWLFAPTSGNCFRRDALKFFLKDGFVSAENLRGLRNNADTYLNRSVCLVSGAILIDMPLTIYRIHGENFFSNGIELYGSLATDPLRGRAADFFAWRAVVDRFFGDDRLLARSLHFQRFCDAIVALQRAHPAATDETRNENMQKHIPEQLARCAEQLKPIFGEANFAALEYDFQQAEAQQQSTLKRRGATRVLVKPLAEFFLSIGRLLNNERLTNIGETLWNFRSP